jgi:EpsI family protein
VNIRRLVLLQVVLLGGLSAVFALPKHPRLLPPAISQSLPDFLGDWYGTEEQITQGERENLGPDTQFSRKKYTNARGDAIHVSIVLSGPDMNTSIHRPERCLPAGGWTIRNSTRVALPGSGMAATRLRNARTAELNNGRSLTINSLNYYWFVGHSDITPSHIERTWIDIRDRILKGYNQQWAYVSVLAWVSRDYQAFGRDEQQTDEMIQAFIRDLVPELQKSSVAGR